MNRSVGDIILVVGACLFGSWTVFCYVMVLSESSFSDLKTWSFVPVVIGLGIAALCMGKFALVNEVRTEGMAQPTLTSGAYSGRLWALLTLIISALMLRIFDIQYWSVWVVLLCASILVFRTVLTSTSTLVEKCNEPRVPRSNWQWVGVAVLIALGVAVVAITHRPDQDDSQYLNFVVTAMDFLFEPLFSHSGLWQDPKVPLESPIYRFHTYELLVAALSDAFGVDHKVLYYLILAPIFGGIAVVVHWRLAQYLIPQYAISALLAWFVLMIALGDSHREFGNFAFVRLYQGKGLLVTIALPLCLLLGLRFSELPDGRRALALGMAIIASAGLSSSALATVPFVVAATLCGGLLGASRVAVTRIIAGGLASGLFLCAIGLSLVASIKSGYEVHGVSLFGSGPSLSIVLGEGILGALILVLFPIAPLFVAGVRRRRLYAMTTLIFVGVVLNPWSGDFLAKNLDKALEWRLFWSVPFAISASISMVGLAALLAGKVRWLKRYAVLLIMLAAVLMLSRQWSVSPDNRVVIAFPRIKVEPAPHALAEEIVRRAPLRSTIYAPTWIAEWIPTFRVHPYPLIVRPHYFDFGKIRDYFGNSELDRRRRVIAFLQGEDKDFSTVAFFQSQLAIDRPTFVVYDSRVERAPAIEEVLFAAGYVDEKRDIYRLWHLP
ncbi:MAG: DUF6077 domain-containing protein [Halioglobus sp.]|nr:DUF6077 domain-containing protein [Halioglobus sp.]